MHTNAPVRVAQVVGRMMASGVEAVVMNYYQHMDRDRIQFDFVANENSTVVPEEEITALGGRVYRIPSYKHLPQYVHSLQSLFERNRYQIVHSNVNALSVFSLYAAKKAGVPVRIAHSHSTAAPGEWKKTAVKNVLRPFSRVYPTHYCACSDIAARWLFGNQLVDAQKVRIVRNAIDLQRFMYTPALRLSKRQELGIGDQFVVGHVGRFCYQKNQLFLLDIFKEVLRLHENSLLLLVGDGDMRPQLEQKIQDLGLGNKVLLLGVREDVHTLYQAMDVFVLPSAYEGLPVVAIEAQAAGLPMIASTQVTKESQVTDLLQFHALTASPASWAQAALSCRQDARRSPCEELRAAGYDIVQNARALCDYYLRILHTGKLQTENQPLRKEG